MKLAFLMPLSQKSIQTAVELKYDAIEIGAGWMSPAFDDLERDLPALKDALDANKIAISSVAIYGGTITASVAEAVAYWKRAIQMARKLDCGVVSGLTGRDNALTFDENLPLFKERFEQIAQIASDEAVRIALEPWPGSVRGHGPYHWTNMATTPELWAKLIEAVPNQAMGFEYDPSHFYWQEIDYIRAIRDFADRIHHMHAKDIVVDCDKRSYVGVHGNSWWRFVIPGLGVLDWQAIFDTLKEVGYQGDVAVEHEDNVYLNERWNEGLSIAIKYLRPFVDSYNS
ncbi:MAG: sugar phosphate isomerase/epimerase [Chloroflexi bacterium]|nr:sugar phosphate isomerase/epimerase [Chloroflexota bacterium]